MGRYTSHSSCDLPMAIRLVIFPWLFLSRSSTNSTSSILSRSSTSSILSRSSTSSILSRSRGEWVYLAGGRNRVWFWLLFVLNARAGKVYWALIQWHSVWWEPSRLIQLLQWVKVKAKIRRYFCLQQYKPTLLGFDQSQTKKVQRKLTPACYSPHEAASTDKN